MAAGGVEVVVAGHICFDMIPRFPEGSGSMKDLLVPGKLALVGPAVTATGGAVSNTGIALYRLGHRVGLMGKVGDDLFGRAILDILRAVDPSLADGMIVSKGEDSSYSVVISPPGEDRFFIHCCGANDTFGCDDVDGDEVSGAKLFHFGYPPVMRRMYEGGGGELARMFERVKGLGVTTSLDLAVPDPDADSGRADWRAILARTLPHVDVCLPSLDEIAFMLDRSVCDMLPGGVSSEILSSLSAQLIEMGAAVVAIKLGEDGLYLRTSADPSRIEAMGPCRPGDAAAWTGRELLVPSFKVEVAGTTGAGDCTIAGFLSGLMRAEGEGGPAEVMTAAVAVGAFSVEAADATSGVPEWQAVEERAAARGERLSVDIDLAGWDRDSGGGLWTGPGDASRA